MNHVHGTCSVTDPFCVHAKGATRPDGGPPTIPYQIRALVPLTANGTSGGCRYTFVPSHAYQYINAAYATGNWTNVAAFLSAGGNAFAVNNAREIRIVSFGVIIRSMMTASTAKGVVILNVDPLPLAGAVNEAGSMQGSESTLITLAAGLEYSWVSKAMGNSAHAFRQASEFTSTNTNYDWTSLVVEVNNSDTTAATPYLSAEIVMNVEFTVYSSQNTHLAMLQKPPAQPNRLVTAAQERVHATTSSFIEGGITKATKALEGYAKSALDDIMSEGLGMLFL